MSELNSARLPSAHALRKMWSQLGAARRKARHFYQRRSRPAFVSGTAFWWHERGNPIVVLGTLATATFVLGLHDRRIG